MSPSLSLLSRTRAINARAVSRDSRTCSILRYAYTHVFRRYSPANPPLAPVQPLRFFSQRRARLQTSRSFPRGVSFSARDCNCGECVIVGRARVVKSLINPLDRQDPPSMTNDSARSCGIHRGANGRNRGKRFRSLRSVDSVGSSRIRATILSSVFHERTRRQDSILVVIPPILV